MSITISCSTRGCRSFSSFNRSSTISFTLLSLSVHTRLVNV